MSTPPVVFIHGLWIHASAWEPWAALYRGEGYDPVVAGWPGDSDTVDATRRNGDRVGGYGVADVVEHYRNLIASLPVRPVVIEHSFGGLIAQRLLDSGDAAAAVAIDPAPIRGVTKLPLSQIRSTLPVLRSKANREKAVTLSERQFRYAIANAIPREEAGELYRKWSIPAPGKPLFEVVGATKDPVSPTRVDIANSRRGPLLIIGGGRDHIVAEVVARQAADLHARSHAVTDYHVFADRGHSLIIDSRWREVADFTVGWVNAHHRPNLTFVEGAQQ
ncbi:alpha/beta hydrolase [Mycolicibacterium sp. S2-37]|uniref:alpha/beta hydrolase n=1 Tax=Mycolicibacterium sp. S2-37 TaxID=2810297 RepID=UPI001A9494F9|nr:alpha/beta hydrolase [Mycolicibacterium sp. S2-37]MBO0678901.1 alpha/beta hydrolase [Mycolicibacterium sp. S2-37]